MGWGGIRVGLGSRIQKPQKRAKAFKMCEDWFAQCGWVRVGLGWFRLGRWVCSGAVLCWLWSGLALIKARFG